MVEPVRALKRGRWSFRTVRLVKPETLPLVGVRSSIRTFWLSGTPTVVQETTGLLVGDQLELVDGEETEMEVAAAVCVPAKTAVTLLLAFIVTVVGLAVEEMEPLPKIQPEKN